jgi:hypothetical protein
MPPAPKGTMIFKGLLGKLAAVWATVTGEMAIKPVATSNDRKELRFLFMY